MKRLQKIFENGKPLIAYITAGYPTLSKSEESIKKMIDLGVRIFELGVPFSDPMADGDTIQHAMRVAVKNNVDIQKTIELGAKIRQYNSECALLVMSYSNPVYKMGYSNFAASLKDVGLDGAIIPDLPPDEGKKLYTEMKVKGLAAITFLTPLTSAIRVKRIASAACGFIYIISHPGITGSGFASSPALQKLLTTARKVTDVPLCVGFGIKTKKDIQKIEGKIDGYIVGSEIIKAIDENRLESAVKALL